MRNSLKLLMAFLSVMVMVSCIEEEFSHEEIGTYINGGYDEPGQPGVVYIMHNWGYGCTGTLIAPTVVLTAKHCVRDLDNGIDLPTYGFSVNVGSDAWSITNTYGVSSIVKYPGDEIENEDVALMVLSSSVPDTVAQPYKLRVTYGGEFPLTANESLVSIIGYGESVCGASGNSGVKLRTEDLYMGTMTAGDFWTQGRGANHGDSGGPIFDSEMRVLGVTSRGSDECTGELAGITIGASVIYHLDFINEVLEDEGYCAATHESEVCGDGKDNDCNGLVDDSCLDDGTICEFDYQCLNGICFEQSGEKRCLESCDPLSGTNTCGSGKYCRITECNRAICSPGTAGSKGFYELCNVDTDCESLFCRSASDGLNRCLYPCEPGYDQCMTGEVCDTVLYGCGGCIPSEESDRDVNYTGEPCDKATDCSSGICIEVGDISYCSDSCSNDLDCISTYHCDGARCIKGERGVLGDPCLVDGDCENGMECIDAGTGIAHCTTDCSTEACPDANYTCYDVSGGRYCLNYLGGDAGDVCSVASPCQPDFTCREITTGEFRCVNYCSRQTAWECPSYTFCEEMGSYNYCVPMERVVSEGGGSSSGCMQIPSGRNSSSAVSVFMLLFSMILIRRFRS
ncbi:MAG: S1 family peptidase [Deltaproteobacteria bacterium]|nr:S1 family peptidase [Deltaproteobacteria bacterium]